MGEFLGIGILLGLSAGFSPGPLLMLTISETLRHGTGSGIRVALAPVITDLPIVTVTLLLLARVAGYQGVLGAISLAGGVFVLFTAWEALRIRPVSLDLPTEAPRSLIKGVVTNLLSPHPYLFWIGVGAPMLAKARTFGMGSAAAFIGGFYLCLIGSKVVLAAGVGRSRQLLGSRLYLTVMRLLGLLLVLFALLLFREGLTLLGLT